MFIDTHAHMNLMTGNVEGQPLQPEHIESIKKIVDQAVTVGVGAIINVGTGFQDSQDCTSIARAFHNVFAAVGLHPCSSFSDWKDHFTAIKTLLKNKEQNKIIAIGEIGFDFHHEPFYKDHQTASFRAQIELALENKLPIIVHVRKAPDEFLAVVSEYVKDGLIGVIHCLTQDQAFTTQALALGFYIGIDGHITYPKNDALRATIKNVPLSQLLLETDAPFLPPQQFRGKQSSPAYIPLIADFIASLKDVSLAEIEEKTTANAIKLFQLPI
ncbi:MAG: Mg-dependent DNase [candidate division TM6 bacterium GW2011_GWF2_37_49]|nr:MAG: Mg-dependent DNase [candidate division TM6 bacterium GW2011_GWF2_37_49]